MTGNTVEEIRANTAAGDAIRDEGLTYPEDVVRCTDLSYGPEGISNLLDVYYPQGTDKPLPTIISVHGGGWIYGDKELYSHYCTRLAKRGFTVVNFNYRLAPEHKYPAQLADICLVAGWILENAENYFIDTDNLFMVGDSAGGQMCYQFLTLLTSSRYASLFGFTPPKDFRVRACGLNCGCYFIPASRFLPPKKLGLLMGSYLPDDHIPVLEQLRTHKYITKDFPPAFITTAQNDYLKMMAAPCYRGLRRKGVEAQLHIYGTKEEKHIGHVFHLNCRLPLADICNDQQTAFFRAHVV